VLLGLSDAIYPGEFGDWYNYRLITSWHWISPDIPLSPDFYTASKRRRFPLKSPSLSFWEKFICARHPHGLPFFSWLKRMVSHYVRCHKVTRPKSFRHGHSWVCQWALGIVQSWDPLRSLRQSKLATGMENHDCKYIFKVTHLQTGHVPGLCWITRGYGVVSKRAAIVTIWDIPIHPQDDCQTSTKWKFLWRYQWYSGVF